jgi:hypothetical protein
MFQQKEEKLASEADNGMHGNGAIVKSIFKVGHSSTIFSLINIGLTALLLILYVVRR